MKYLYVLVVTLLLFSCGNEKSVLLSEIENAKVTEILDVSPAYLFYDETQPDSLELNRKNLIGTTNWLFNVDKRLTLEQAIPKIKFLQDKKRNAEVHKNENAKNYYTCNDTSIQNLGFIEFTDVYYLEQAIGDHFTIKSDKPGAWSNLAYVEVRAKDSINLTYFFQNADSNTKSDDLESYLSNLELFSETFAFNQLQFNLNEIPKDITKIVLSFNEKLLFQDYIEVKSYLQQIIRDKDIYFVEFIY